MPPRPRVNISVPEADAEKPRLGRLGAVVAVCFLLGLLWPLLADSTFVQRPPGSNPPPPPEEEPAGGEGEPAPRPEPASDPGDAVRAAAALKPALTRHETVRVEEIVLVSCSDGAGPLTGCDTPSLADRIEDPIAKLSRCAAADGASGVLSLGLRLDFERERVTQVKAGKSTTFSSATSAALLACAKGHMVGMRLNGVQHQHGAYWLYYLIRFLPPGSPMDLTGKPPSDALVSASGQGTIGWKTAIMREGPSREAKIAARLLYGTRVDVTGRVGEWYRIEHAGSTGWVHGKAIGM